MRDSINENIIQLLDKQLRNVALSNEELLEIKQWVDESESNRQLYNELTTKKSLDAALREFGMPDTEASLRKMRQQLFGEETEKPVPVRRINYKPWLAAAVIAGLAVGGFFLFNPSADDTTVNTTVAQQEKPEAFTNQIPPGGELTRLTLSNGSTIILDSNQRGVLAIEESAILHGEKLLVNLAIANNNTAGEVLYNTLSTPRGFFKNAAQEVILPDNSHVWLSPASSLSFPDAFTGTKRLVKISGEAYFEVEKDDSKPFIVQALDADVEVLGTHFNVTAYEADNTITASLVEGSIQISRDNNSKILKPAQEAIIKGKGEIKVRPINTGDVTDRRNGVYKFENVSLEAVMNQVKRIYRVAVDYKQGNYPTDLFVTINSNKKLADELEKLNRLGDFTCDLDGNTITITPNKTGPHP